ncbi:MAG: MGMT family protein [Bacillota bacterium]
MKKISEFNKKVYDLVALIPAGKIATYGQIAAMIGSPRAARAVGTAMQNTPEYLDIPCHRVISGTGKMAPAYAFGGKERQRELLEAEGVIFNDNDCVDMESCLWQRDEKL